MIEPPCMVTKEVGTWSFSRGLMYLIIFIDLTVCFLLNPLTFTSSVYSNEDTWFLILLPLNTLLLLVAHKKAFYRIQSLNVAAAVLGVILLLQCLIFSSNYSFCNQHFFSLSAILFTSTTFALVVDVKDIEYIIFFLFLIYLFEMFLGIYQLVGIVKYNADVSSLLVGTFSNSGIFACYLSIMQPIVIYETFFTKKFKSFSINHKIRIISFLILVISTLILLILTKSRTALISLSAVSIAFIHPKVFSKMPKTLRNKFRISLFVIIAICCSILFSLLFQKQTSLLGRIQMSYIALKHIDTNILNGIGLGRFTNYYPDWQSEFYRIGDYPKIFLKNVGENYVIFNEYLQLLIEVGIFGFFLFLILVIKTLIVREHSSVFINRVLPLTALGILFCGFTSYPFHVSAFVFLLGFCGTTLVVRNNYYHSPRNLKKDRFLYLAIVVTLIFSSMYVSYLAGKRFIAIYEWRKVTKNYKLSRNESKNEYKRLLIILKDDAKYATQLGKFLLLDSSDCEEAVVILENTIDKVKYRTTCEALIMAYEKCGNDIQAIKQAEWLVNYLPHLIGPKFQLLKLNIKIGRTKQALAIANNILETPERVSSNKFSKIRQFATEYISMYENIQGN